MHIRDAAVEDAEAACRVLRRSIAALCDADHHNDPEILNRWLANKTPENLKAWILQPGGSILIATDGATILAIGGVTDAGEITLNYVAPEARFHGVSRAILRALEQRALQRGNTRCTLLSTETAHRFYRANGYTDDGAVTNKFGAAASYPMSKLLPRDS